MFYSFSRGKKEDLRKRKKTFLARFWVPFFSGPFLTVKLGKFWFFLPKCRRQIGLMPYIYTYIYIHTPQQIEHIANPMLIWCGSIHESGERFWQETAAERQSPTPLTWKSKLDKNKKEGSNYWEIRNTGRRAGTNFSMPNAYLVCVDWGYLHASCSTSPVSLRQGKIKTISPQSKIIELKR